MRDYKHVRVPRKYRSASNRTVVVNRVTVGRRARAETSGTWTKRFLQGVSLVMIAGGVYLGWMGYQWFVHAGAFQIAGVDVKGVKHLSEDEVRKIAGVFTGENIFLADIETAARRARSNPWVKDVRVYRNLPNRISMQVTERTPVAVLDNGRGLYLMDHEAVIIERTGKKTPAPALPRVKVKGCAAEPGAALDTVAVQEALVLLSELRARGGWRVQDMVIAADTPDSLTVLYADRAFKIGRGNYAEKLRRLGEVVADLRQRGRDFAYVDLRPERQAAVMVKK